MNHSKFSDMSREEKQKYAEEKMKEMKLKNIEMQKRHSEVEKDRKAAEEKNSSVTNSSKAEKEERVCEENNSERGARGRIRKTREWDRVKFDDDEWNDRIHKGFNNYIRGYETKHFSSTSSKYERPHGDTDNRRSYRSSDRRSMPSFHDSSKKSKESRYQNSESSRTKQHSHEKYRSYYSAESKKYHYKYPNQSSYKSESKHHHSRDKKEPSVWHEEQDDNEYEQDRTHKWVQSLPKSVIDEGSTSEEDIKVNTSPKRKYDKLEETSLKCLTDNDLSCVGPSGRRKSDQNSSLKSRKIDYVTVKEQKRVHEKKRSKVNSHEKSRVKKDSVDSHAKSRITRKLSSDYHETPTRDKSKEHKVMTQVFSDQNKSSSHKSYSKFDRFEHSDQSSSESDSVNLCGTVSKSISEANYNLESEKVKFETETQKNNLSETETKNNLKSPNIHFKQTGDQNKQPSNFGKKDTELNSTEKSPPPPKSVYICKANYDNTDKNFKKSSKSEWDYQNKSSDHFKNDCYIKQKKFDKPSGSDSLNTLESKNGDNKSAQCYSIKKKSFFDKNLGDGWGNSSEIRDIIWSNIAQSYDEDDGIWGSYVQCGSKYNVSEDEECAKNEKTKPASYNDGASGSAELFDKKSEANENKKTAQNVKTKLASRSTEDDAGNREKKFVSQTKQYRARNDSSTDDGGDSLEEGEIRSEDSDEKCDTKVIWTKKH